MMYNGIKAALNGVHNDWFIIERKTVIIYRKRRVIFFFRAWIDYIRVCVSDVDSLEDIKEAMAIIEPLKQTDLSLYETLSDRVMKEYLSVIYLKIKLYRNLYSEAEVNEMIETFEYYIQKFEITKQGEGFDINGIFG